MERRELRQSLIKLFPTLIKIFLFCIAIGSVAVVVFAKYQTTSITGDIIVVSAKPKAEDAYFILRSKTSHHLVYLRAETAFAQALQKSFPTTAPEAATESFFRTVGRKAVARLTTEEANAEIARQSWHEDVSQEFPTLAATICLGLGLGLLFAGGSSTIVPTLLLCCGVATLKVLTTCPTCPRPEILGIDAAVLGLVAFTGLSVAFILPSGPQLLSIKKWVLFTALSSIITWQIVMWWITKLNCPPCSMLAFLMAWQVGSSGRWLSETGRVFAIRPAVVATGILVVAAFIVSPHISADVPKQSAHLSALGLPKPSRIANLKQAGLPVSGKRQVMFIAAWGCHACEEQLGAFDSLHLTNLDFYYVGPQAPDSKRKWNRFPNGENIRITPTTLFVEKDGTVLRQQSGFHSNPEALAADIQQISDFLSGKNVPMEE